MRRLFITAIFFLSATLIVAPQARGAVVPNIADDSEKPVLKDVDVRVLGREGRILLSRKEQVFCVAQIRPFKGNDNDPSIAPVSSKEDASAALKSTQPKDQPLAGETESSERVREYVYPLPTKIPNDELSVLLRVRKVSHGTRVLVNGLIRGLSRIDLAPDETLPAPAALELTIQIYPDSQGKPPVLTYVDGQHQPVPIDQEARSEAEKLDLAGRVLNARSMVFEGADGFRVNLARSGPISWTLIRSGDGWLLRQKLLPDPREAANIGSFIFYLGGWVDEAQAEISELKLSHPQVAAREVIEGSARVYASGANVYNLSELAVVAEIALPPRPNGEIPIKRLPCFFYEGPTGQAGTGKHSSEGEFRFRFAPPQEGVYGVRLVSISSTGEVHCEAQAFHAAPPASAGFIRTRAVLKTFAYDNGDIFVPVGVRLVLPPGRVASAEIRKVLIDLARRGVNTVHLTLSRETFPFEKIPAGRYDADVAASLDDIFCAAQVRGIHLILGLENGDDLGKFSDRHPYFREQNGPLSASPEFFRDVKVRKLYQNRLTYIAARYGAYRSLLSWELIDGVERVWPAIRKDPEDRLLTPGEADLSRRGRRDIQEWVRESAQFLHGMDQHEHPICVSTGLGAEHPWVGWVGWVGLEKIETLDWILRQGVFPTERDVDNEDETILLARWLTATREPGRAHKPVLIEHIFPEQWPATISTEPNVLELARTQIGRNLLHAGWACGAAGPVLRDWNGPATAASLDEMYPVLNLVAGALAKITKIEGSELRYLSGEIQSTLPLQAPLRYWGRSARRGLCVWIQDPRATWKSKIALSEIEGAELKLSGLDEGKYTVKWYDAFSGRLLKQEAYDAPAKKIDHPTDPLILNFPKIKEAIILLIEPLSLK